VWGRVDWKKRGGFTRRGGEKVRTGRTMGKEDLIGKNASQLWKDNKGLKGLSREED